MEAKNFQTILIKLSLSSRRVFRRPDKFAYFVSVRPMSEDRREVPSAFFIGSRHNGKSDRGMP
jgi:hypothetical protein